MKVRITEGAGWYSNRVGEIFDIARVAREVYFINENHFIKKEDCEVVKDLEFIVGVEYICNISKGCVIGPNAYCDECRHLNITEEEQDRIKSIRKHNTPISLQGHFCIKYGKKVQHGHAHPEIYKCKECLDM